MNYANLNKTIMPKMMAAIAVINNPEIAPDVRQLNLEILFREVGSAVYEKVYDMNAFDFDIQYTQGPGMDDRYYGMAKVASGSISTGKLGLEATVKAYLDNVAGQAQMHAVRTARETKNYPRVIRVAVGDTCKWCRDVAGTYTNPPADVFRRHDNCDCEIRTEGYKSRNGLLSNYKKQNA